MPFVTTFRISHQALLCDSAVGNAVGDSVGVVVGYAVGNALIEDANVGNAVGCVVGNAVGNPVGGEVPPNIGRLLGSAVPTRYMLPPKRWQCVASLHSLLDPKAVIEPNGLPVAGQHLYQ